MQTTIETGEIIELLRAIWARLIDPSSLYTYLTSIISRLDSLKSDTSAILGQVQAINATTTTIQTALNNAITLLTAIQTDTATLIVGLNNVLTELNTANTDLQALVVNTQDIKADLATLILEVQDFKTSTLAKLNDLLKYEDSPSVSGDGGVSMLTVRQDILSSSTSATGDYIQPSTDLYGRLHVTTDGVPVLRTDILVNTPSAGITRTYVGWALPGTIDSASTWKIMKMEEIVATGSLTITWGSGVMTYTNIWNNRASLSYN
jgi:hypothetical protein